MEAPQGREAQDKRQPATNSTIPAPNDTRPAAPISGRPAAGLCVPAIAIMTIPARRNGIGNQSDISIGRGAHPGPQALPRHTTATASISTSIAAAASRLTSTIVAAGLTAANTSACARAASSQRSMSVR